MGFVGLVPSCLRGYLLDPKFFLEVFSRENFVGPKHFLICISWVYFFLEGISCVQNFFSWVLRVVVFFLVGNIVIQRFSVVGCMKKSDRKQKYRNEYISNRAFYPKSISTIVSSVYIRKVHHLLN